MCFSGASTRLQFSGCKAHRLLQPRPAFIWPHAEPGFRSPSPSCERELPQHPQNQAPSPHRRVFCSSLTNPSLNAPRPVLASQAITTTRCAHAPVSARSPLPAGRRPAPGPGGPRWERFVSKTGTRAGVWAGAPPSPPQSASCPSRLPLPDTRQGGGRGCLGWGERDPLV